MGHSRDKDRPNALAVGVLLLLLSLAGLSSAVDGVATLVVALAVVGVLYVLWVLTVGWEAPKQAFQAARSVRAPPRAVKADARLARGRVVGAPVRRASRASPTV